MNKGNFEKSEKPGKGSTKNSELKKGNKISSSKRGMCTHNKIQKTENFTEEYHYSILQKYNYDIVKDLLEWYYKYRRKLPWRNDKPPYTTSVQLDEGKITGGDIRHYFTKSDNKKIKKEDLNSYINKNTNNEREKRTIGVVVKVKKEQQNLACQEVKRIKKETILNNENKNIEINQMIRNDENITMLSTCIRPNSNPYNNENVENIRSESINNADNLCLRGYQIYISEIMLQQTKVHTVLNYYIKWMNTWSSIFELAKRNLDDVLILWKGLGYYNRAKNLLECCKTVVEKYNGIFPNDIKLLKELPGIGDYTSKAICIHLYNRKDICIDTNIIRIFSRITDTINYYKSTVLSKHCEEVSHILCSGEFNYSDLSQALMDLGSSVCTNSPLCAKCPLNKYCLIHLKTNKKKYSPFNLIHPTDCTLCVLKRNVEIKSVPLVKRKKKTGKTCLVLLVKREEVNNGDNSGNSSINNVPTANHSRTNHLDDHYLMIKNTDSNLFSMHYLFPLLLIDQFDKKTVHVHLNSLLSKLNLNNSKKDSFTYINHFKHIFSHLTYDTYIYVCSVLDAENTTINGENTWIKLKDIKDFTHNTFCQHIIDHYKEKIDDKKNYFSEFFI
ncbi:A/G-specific adenine glycosylase, putative [Plasmodium malariae]|uniref:Adenine DNA glycosylase n=1 Tax=Plasmodium malariae TaxID=5858 RepID=A0A1A8X4K8_PLAMA|nr:A/G-specific adenine glycosylase, putative [Plasmodium malariae]